MSSEEWTLTADAETYNELLEMFGEERMINFEVTIREALNCYAEILKEIEAGSKVFVETSKGKRKYITLGPD